MELAHLLDQGITIAIGTFFILFGYRIVGKRPGLNARFDEWHARSRGFFKLGGLLLIGMGVLRLFWFSLPITTQAANPASLEWRTVPSSDGVLTVGMPGEPEVESRDEQDSVGPTQVVKQRVGIDDNTILFSLVERHYLDEDVQFDRGPFLDGTAESTLAQSKGELVGESEVHRGDLVGKAISIEMPQEYTVSMQFFLIGRSVYQLKVVTPNAMADSPIVRRFFESLEVDKSRIGTVGDRVSATYGEFSRAD